MAKVSRPTRGIPEHLSRKSGDAWLTDRAAIGAPVHHARGAQGPSTAREARLRERLALALRHAMPEYAQQSAWAAWVGQRTRIGARRVKAHMACEHRCSADDLLAYFAHFGPEFEARVRGDLE